MTEYKGYYFKDAGERPRAELMSGLALPLDADRVCRNVRFIGCEFHPCCDNVRFKGCEFIACDWVPAGADATNQVRSRV